ncbi:MAG: ABC transporter permease subunit [Acidimicrobiales bacterium]
MTATEQLPALADAEAPARRAKPTSGGWRIVAAKEFGDGLLSIRFLILLVLVALVALLAVSSAAGNIRQVASDASEDVSPFLRLFTLSPRFLSFFTMVGFLGPLLGIAFGFDAINNERTNSTLPRLVSQPIYRDDVINGKFAAGLSLISITLVMLTMLVTGLGIFRLGLAPTAGEAARLVLFVMLSIVYVGLWLAVAILASVVFRRAATSALVTLAVWLVFTTYSALIVQVTVDYLAPLPAENPSVEQVLDNARLERNISRLSPQKLYEEASQAILDPELRTFDQVLLREDIDRAVPGTLTLPQSLLVAWPQVTALGAMIVVLFAGAYLAFMRQEIRA